MIGAIRRLHTETPKSIMGQVRWLLPEMEAAFRAGHSLAEVHRTLKANGLEISYKHLSVCLSRVRKERNDQRRSEPLREGLHNRKVEAQSAAPQGRATMEARAGVVTSSLSSPGTSDAGEKAKVPALKLDPLANLNRPRQSVPNFSGTAKKEDLY
jgi:hypothetical protein